MRHLVMIATLVMLAQHVAAQLSRPADHPWARWQDGAWIRMARQEGQRAPLHTTRTLSRLDKAGYRLEEGATQRGGAGQTTVAMPYAMGGAAHTTRSSTIVGKETLMIGGRAFPCNIWKAYWTDNGVRGEESVWLYPSSDLPLKIVTKVGRSWDKLVAVDLDEEIDVGGRRVGCVKYTGHRSQSGVISKVSAWRSLSVPGGLVRLESEVPGTPQIITAAVEFRGEVRIASSK